MCLSSKRNTGKNKHTHIKLQVFTYKFRNVKKDDETYDFFLTYIWFLLFAYELYLLFLIFSTYTHVHIYICVPCMNMCVNITLYFKILDCLKSLNFDRIIVLQMALSVDAHWEPFEELNIFNGCISLYKVLFFYINFLLGGLQVKKTGRSKYNRISIQSINI